MSRLGPGSTADRAFAWVRSVAVETNSGLCWRDGDTASDDLYAGTVGVLLACAEAAGAGLDVAAVAVAARDRLAGLAPDSPTLPYGGLFGGWYGVALALRAWSRETGDDAAGAAADLVTARVAARVLAGSPDPSRYLDVISGDAGILLALLDDPSDPARTAAHLLADRLVTAAEPAGKDLRWQLQAGAEREMPGFSHGTAGVAFALASASRSLERDDLLAAAVRGAEHLITLSGIDTGGGWAVPLVIPAQAHRPPVSFGWCHGPTGAVRLFLLLDEIAPQPRWRAAVDACLQALRDSRLPERLYPGYWDNVGRCCGTAGVGQLLLDRYAASGDPDLLAWTNVLADDVCARAIELPGGVAWSNTEHTATPPDLPPEPGFMQGTAGIAAWLARVDAARAGRPVARELWWV